MKVWWFFQINYGNKIFDNFEILKTKKLKVYKIETDRLIIRCYQPSDASLFSEAINTSLENLKLFMPWAKQKPTSLIEKEILLTKFKADFDAEKDFTFGIFNKQD